VRAERAERVTQDDNGADQGETRHPKVPALVQKVTSANLVVSSVVNRKRVWHIGSCLNLLVNLIVAHESSPYGKN
jgi:hypothetical protein